MSTKSALGRGLGSLIPNKQVSTATHSDPVVEEKSTEYSSAQQILEIPFSKIVVNPRQPRRYFEEEALIDLKSSIAEHGLLQPLVVSKAGSHFELIAGERRLRACKDLGLETVPVIVRDATDQQKLELALIENIQREDLNPVEEALAYKTLVEEFGLRIEAVAQKIGKSRSAVSNLIRMLDLPEHFLDAVRDGRLSKSHARTLLAEQDLEKREELFSAMLKGISVREAENKTSNHGTRSYYGSLKKDPQLLSIERRIRDRLSTKVAIKEKDGRGKLVIDYFSREELAAILEELGLGL